MGEIVKPHGGNRFATLRKRLGRGNIPHVVDAAPDASWESALDGCFETNRKRGSGPTNVRSLAKELRARNPEGQAAESWRRQLSRYRRGEQQPSEQAAKRIAEALGVRRSALPATGPAPTLRQLDARLRALEDGELVTVAELHLLLQAVGHLANRDIPGAQRLLSEAEEIQRREGQGNG